jgi:MFS family permease
LLLVVQLLTGIVLMPQRFFFPIYMEEHLGYAAIVISSWVAIGQFLGMIAAIVGGAVSDTLGRKWTLIFGLIGLVLGGMLYLVQVPGLVFAFWAISGIGLGFHAVGAEGYLIDAARPEHLGVFSALYNWGFTLGGALGSPVAGIVLDRRGFNTFGLLLFAVSSLTALGAVTFLPRLHRAAGKTETSWSRSLLGYRRVLRQPGVAFLGLMRFLPTCYYGMLSVLVPLLINRAADSKTSVALYATISQVLASLAQIVTGRAADRWGPRRPTLVAYVVLVSSGVGLAGTATHLWGFYIFGVAGLCAAWSLSTLMPSLVSITTSVEERGRVIGALHLLWNLGMMVGALVGGALVSIAVGLPFLITGLLNLGTIAIAVSFFRTVRSRAQVSA